MYTLQQLYLELFSYRCFVPRAQRSRSVGDPEPINMHVRPHAQDERLVLRPAEIQRHGQASCLARVRVQRRDYWRGCSSSLCVTTRIQSARNMRSSRAWREPQRGTEPCRSEDGVADVADRRAPQRPRRQQ